MNTSSPKAQPQDDEHRRLEFNSRRHLQVACLESRVTLDTSVMYIFPSNVIIRRLTVSFIKSSQNIIKSCR